jgi:hypothetical protein
MKKFLKSRFTWMVVVYLAGMIYLYVQPPHCITKDTDMFSDGVRSTEFIVFTVWSLAFLLLFLFKKRKFVVGCAFKFYYGNLEENRKNNIFYCWLMFVMSSILLYFNIHLINIDSIDIRGACKIWELTAYWVTVLFTGSIWLSKERGRKILATLEDKQGQTGILLGIAITTLFFFAIAHTFLFFSTTFNDNIRNWIEDHDPLLSLGLIIAVYSLFIAINLTIRKSKDPEVKKDITLMHKYVDLPTFFIFVIMFVFAAYAKYVGCLQEISIFFSGAIAFELIFTSIVYACTNTF